MTINSLLKQAVVLLQARSQTPGLDAELLLAHTLGCQRGLLFTHPERLVTSEENNCFQQLLSRRKQGEPIAYILGHKAFWSLDLTVNKHVLIPRPETELLVETILSLYGHQQRIHLLELGTGSGAISLSIATERPNWHIIATDKSENALQCAITNAKQLAINTIQFIHSDWYAALTPQRFDIIVSNPPYLADNDRHFHQSDIRFEPRMALSAGKDGLDAIRSIAKEANYWLKSPGYLILEHGYQQSNAVQDIVSHHHLQIVNTFSDLAGLPRVSLAKYVNL
ncbi:MAG: peptide chain release factor N(5)-glutamine methyltransferase [Pseudomonadota bacterium]